MISKVPIKKLYVRSYNRNIMEFTSWRMLLLPDMIKANLDLILEN